MGSISGALEQRSFLQVPAYYKALPFSLELFSLPA